MKLELYDVEVHLAAIDGVPYSRKTPHILATVYIVTPECGSDILRKNKARCRKRTTEASKQDMCKEQHLPECGKYNYK